jgi:hypothetical protein
MYRFISIFDMSISIYRISDIPVFLPAPKICGHFLSISNGCSNLNNFINLVWKSPLNQVSYPPIYPLSTKSSPVISQPINRFFYTDAFLTFSTFLKIDFFGQTPVFITLSESYIQSKHLYTFLGGPSPRTLCS